MGTKLLDLNGLSHFWGKINERKADKFPHTGEFDGKKLNNLFTNAAAFEAAVAAGDFSKIHVGDYWEIKLNGTFRDYGIYTVPSGKTYYSNAALTTQVGQTSSVYQGAYQKDNAVKITIDSVNYYVETTDCLAYYERTCSNAVMLLEIAAINPYWRYGDSGYISGAKNHVLFVSRDCLPFTLRMRKSNSVWEDPTTLNPWTGSALYKTLNDPDYGVVKLIQETDIGAYMYAGSDGNGMRYHGEKRDPITATISTGAYFSRGKLFLPTEDEIWGREIFTIRSNHGMKGLPIFDGSRRHISKGIGNGSTRTNWWSMSASADSSTYFCRVSSYCIPNNDGADNAHGAPVCFLIA